MYFLRIGNWWINMTHVIDVCANASGDLQITTVQLDEEGQNMVHVVPTEYRDELSRFLARAAWNSDRYC